MLEPILGAALMAAVVRQSAPLILAAIGGLCSERAGVVNIALEGMMICGAFCAALAARQSGSPWVGLAAGMACGGMVGLIHAILSVSAGMDHIISGTAINVVALGAPAMVLESLFPGAGGQVAVPTTFAVWAVPGLSELPVLGTALFRHTPPIYLACLLPPLLYLGLRYTVIGLRLRAVGDAPGVVERAGVSPTRLRYTGVILSGLAAGAAGSILVLSLSSEYVREVSAGRGFIALAALILGRWRPLRTLAACVLFGGAAALVMRLQGSAILPPAWVQLLPYVLTLIVLVVNPGRTPPPASLGRPYRSGAPDPA